MRGAEASSGSVGSAAAVPLELDILDRSSTKKRSSSGNAGLPQPVAKKPKRNTAAANKQEATDTSCLMSVSAKEEDEDDPVGEDSLVDQEFIQEPVTGRRLFRRDSITVIRRLQETLPSSDPFNMTTWKIKEKKSGYIFKAKFLDSWPIESFKTTASPSAELAEQTGCFHICKQLHKLGVLNFDLFPWKEKKRDPVCDHDPSIAGQTAKSSNTTRMYARRRPQFLTFSVSSTPRRLYPLIAYTTGFQGQEYAPMLLLAGVPWPHLPDFTIFLSAESSIVSLQRVASFEIEHDKLLLLHQYTLRLSRTAINKDLECGLESMPLFFAPLDTPWEAVSLSQAHCFNLPAVEDRIPWTKLQQANENWVTGLLEGEQDLTDALIRDCAVQDRAVEFTNRFSVVRIRPDITPMSKPEPGIREAESGCSNYLEYCESRVKNFQGIRDPNQPMIEVTPIPASGNYLSPIRSSPKAPPKFLLKYLIPELTVKCTIPASVLRMASALPSITYMIERLLLVKELNARYFDSAIDERHLLAAITAPTAMAEQDYERLELLGDTYIKYVSSVYLYATTPDKREGALNHARSTIVSNKALHMGALKCGIPPYIQSKPLIVKIWTPAVTLGDANSGDKEAADEGHAFPGSGDRPTAQKGRKRGKRKKQLDEHSIQWLGDKTVADVVEAIIGAAFLSGGYELAFRTTKRLQLNLPNVEKWSDLALRSVASSVFSRGLNADTVAAVTKIMGHEIKDSALLEQALTHTSAAVQGINYERLEFLGDAVLDMLTVSFIYDKYPRSPPSALSLLKAAMVANSALATICVVTGLYKHLNYKGGAVKNTIDAYVKKILKLKDEEYQRALAQSRLPGQFWLEAEPPKLLSDVVEAILGVIFVSDGYINTGAQQFFDTVLKPFYIRHVRLQTLSMHPATTLFQLMQAEGCQVHHIRKTIAGSDIRCEVVVHDVSIAVATDIASNMAKRKAAMAALDVFANDPSIFTKVCDCKTAQRGKQEQEKTKLGYEDEEDALAVESALLDRSTD